MGKNTSKNLSSKCSQELFDHAEKSATDALKTSSKRALQKATEATGGLICNKIDYRITKVFTKLYILPQNNSVAKEEEILKERYISPKERQKIIHDLGLI